MELPPDFIHTAPKGYSYEVEQIKRNYLAIWIVNHSIFSYTNTPPRSIWGFVKYKTTKKGGTSRTYYAPINSNKVGKEVDINDTQPYSAMQLNLTALEAAFF
jgi:hypothetical protein